MKTSATRRLAESRAQFLAGDLALDFLNTRIKIEGEIVDILQTDEDVLSWLAQAGASLPEVAPNLVPSSLIGAARILRENIRSLVEKRRARMRGDPCLLNRFLDDAKSWPRLVWENASLPTVERRRQQNTAEGILAPIAEAAAVLLATADFQLVKRCEDPACSLWFYDQTKSHRRRWCSVFLCGNRHKVRAYRKRRRHPAS